MERYFGHVEIDIGYIGRDVFPLMFDGVQSIEER
jgi:hypothetical protein